jgi:serine/threonine-protein kinase
LFTGQPPFEGDNTGEIIRQVINEEPTPPSEITDLPDELDEILLRALEKKKDHRHESVLLLRDDLQGLFDSLD